MAGNPLTDPDWAANTTDQVVRLVDNVKSKTTKPAVMAARGLVFGLLAAFLGLFALVLLLVGTTRGLQAAIEPLTDQASRRVHQLLRDRRHPLHRRCRAVQEAQRRLEHRLIARVARSGMPDTASTFITLHRRCRATLPDAGRLLH